MPILIVATKRYEGQRVGTLRCSNRRRTVPSPYKDALHSTGCERIEATVRKRRLLWSGGVARGNGPTTWQRIVGCLASPRTRISPHYNLVEGLWPRGRGKRKTRRNPLEEKKDRGGRQGRCCTWGDRMKLETFQSRVDWTDPRTPEVGRRLRR